MKPTKPQNIGMSQWAKDETIDNSRTRLFAGHSQPTLGILSSAFAVALGLWTGPAVAADSPPRFEITPLFGYVFGGTFEDKNSSQELELGDSPALGLKLNIRADYETTWEVLYAKQDSETETPGLPSIDVTIERLEVGGTYEMSSAPTRPYAAATLGVSRFDPKNSAYNDDTYFSFSLGGGVKFFSDRPVGIAVDARWLGAFIDEDTDVFCLSSGGLTCLIQTDAGLTSQFRVFLGINARF